MPLIQTQGAASARSYGENLKTGSAVYIEDVFSTWLYTGNGTTQTITNGIDLSTKGGLVWIKNRSATADHAIYDTTRPVETSFYNVAPFLSSNRTDPAYYSFPQNNGLSNFGNSGFQVIKNGTPSPSVSVNDSGANYVSWTFRKQPKFFDIVTYTGDSNTGRTISHNLNSVPGCIIIKCTSTVGGWRVYHRSLTSTGPGVSAYLRLDSTDAVQQQNYIFGFSGQPTSTTFGVGNDGDVNASGQTYVAYLFAHDAGGFGNAGTDNVISCGSYTTDASGNGTLQNIGFEPQWVMVKASTGAAEEWVINDSMRGMFANPTGSAYALRPNTSGAESLYGLGANISPTGFTGFGSGNRTYIYIAIRRGPMKTPTVGTSVFSPVAFTGSGVANQTVNYGVTNDAHLYRNRTTTVTNGFLTSNRLLGNGYLLTAATQAFGSSTVYGVQYSLSQTNTGVTYGTNVGVEQNQGNLIGYSFLRAPGFFDVVCYTGDDAVSRSISHNLGSKPECIFIKCRSTASTAWISVNRTSEGVESVRVLNSTSAGVFSPVTNNNNYCNLGNSSTFNVTSNFENYDPSSGAGAGNMSSNGAGRTYVAYLFASAPGVSKVGSYTGNGSSQTINCGFAAGARFILIKRTDSTGDWYVWDSARGIVALNDPHLSLNTTAAEVTTDDSIDTDSTGFIVNQLAATNINVTSATYIFLAIA